MKDDATVVPSRLMRVKGDCSFNVSESFCQLICKYFLAIMSRRSSCSLWWFASLKFFCVRGNRPSLFLPVMAADRDTWSTLAAHCFVLYLDGCTSTARWALPVCRLLNWFYGVPKCICSSCCWLAWSSTVSSLMFLWFLQCLSSTLWLTSTFLPCFFLLRACFWCDWSPHLGHVA